MTVGWAALAQGSTIAQVPSQHSYLLTPTFSGDHPDGLISWADTVLL